ncbi:hypothetical protein BS47DRAFT_27559 [Hydnum rufescens UP504]|uniref:Uncharacterized protein n=1 Tax=Hydnum rufescens UP504 TaxID=1448309 RepID=A0A9P6E1Z1_9AGAM|nr:hypothetical protein BS47DRAFT_27559 [Hydnum rufescens UP504]
MSLVATLNLMRLDRELPVTPSTHSAEIRRRILAHARRFPNLDYPRRRYYLLPSSDQPHEAVPRAIVRDADPPGRDIEATKQAILNLLGPGCEATDSQTLYSEDVAEILRGNPKGAGAGHTYKVRRLHLFHSRPN